MIILEDLLKVLDKQTTVVIAFPDGEKLYTGDINLVPNKLLNSKVTYVLTEALLVYIEIEKEERSLE